MSSQYSELGFLALVVDQAIKGVVVAVNHD